MHRERQEESWLLLFIGMLAANKCSSFAAPNEGSQKKNKQSCISRRFLHFQESWLCVVMPTPTSFRCAMGSMFPFALGSKNIYIFLSFAKTFRIF